MCSTRYLFGVKCIMCGILPFNLVNNKKESGVTIFDHERSTVSGFDRLYRMFTIDEAGCFSRELTTVYQATVFGAFAGATYGGFKSTKPTPEEVERTKALALKTKFHERHTFPSGKTFAAHFIKEAVHWGWRVSLLWGSAMLISTATSVYMGKSGVVEYSVTGGVFGTVLQWKGGLRAMGFGGLLGTAFGTAVGCVIYATHKLGGTTTQEVRFWQYGWQEAQLKHTKEGLKKLSEERQQYMENENEGPNESGEAVK